MQESDGEKIILQKLIKNALQNYCKTFFEKTTQNNNNLKTMNKTTLKKLNEVSSPCLSHKQQNMCEKEILEQELLGAKKKLTIIKHQVMTS